MRIESLAPQPDRAGRHRTVLSSGEVLRLYPQTVEDLALYPGRELGEEELEQLRRRAGQMSAKMRAVRMVAASSISRQDLEQRLIRKGEDPAQAREAVTWMEELNLVDDARTARQVVEGCIRKGYGCQRAKQALYEKRIPREYWEEALADYPDQQEKILAFLRSRLQGDWDEKDVKRAVDALLRRGHRYEAVKSALERLQVDLEEDTQWQT